MCAQESNQLTLIADGTFGNLTHNFLITRVYATLDPSGDFVHRPRATLEAKVLRCFDCSSSSLAFFELVSEFFRRFANVSTYIV